MLLGTLDFYFVLIQFEDEQDVYEVVDEEKYAKIVQERQEEDFIVDDGKMPIADIILNFIDF